MKTLLFIVAMFFLVNVGYSQRTNQKSKIDTKQTIPPIKRREQKPIKNFDLPKSYYGIVLHDNGTFDTVMLFRDPIVKRN